MSQGPSNGNQNRMIPHTINHGRPSNQHIITSAPAPTKSILQAPIAPTPYNQAPTKYIATTPHAQQQQVVKWADPQRGRAYDEKKRQEEKRRTFDRQRAENKMWAEEKRRVEDKKRGELQAWEKVERRRIEAQRKKMEDEARRQHQIKMKKWENDDARRHRMEIARAGTPRVEGVKGTMYVGNRLW